MQARIQQARREAETLKDRIKRKKDELADTTRQSSLRPLAMPIAHFQPLLLPLLTCNSPAQSVLWPSRLTSRSQRTS